MFDANIAIPMTKMTRVGNESLSRNFLRLGVYFPTSTHAVKTEYLIYTYDNFVADTGGYLGLLLGQRYA